VTRHRCVPQLISVKSILTTLLVGLLVAPASAVAHTAVLVPPGDSATSQYVETVPTDRGGALPGSGTQPNALTPSQGRRLAGLGPDGRTLVAVVQATSPPPVATPSSDARVKPNAHPGASTQGSAASGSVGTAGPSGRAVPLSAAGAPSTASLMLTAATGGGGGGLGIFLPLLLLASALGVVLHAVVRWRTRSS
jgi:hypothetical protein